MDVVLPWLMRGCGVDMVTSQFYRVDPKLQKLREDMEELWENPRGALDDFKPYSLDKETKCLSCTIGDDGIPPSCSVSAILAAVLRFRMYF